MSDYLDPNNEELLKDFFAEAQAQVEALEQNILVLEQDPANKDAVDEIFRAAHTLKGGAGTVQMMELAEFTHVVEDVLDAIRSNKLSANPDLVDLLLQSIDVIKEMLELRMDGKIYKNDTTPLKKALQGLLKSGETPSVQAPKETPKQPPRQTSSSAQPSASSGIKNIPISSGGLNEYERMELSEAANGKRVYKISVHFDETNPMNSVGGIQVFAVLKELGTVIKTHPDFDKLYEDNFFEVVDYYMTVDVDWSLLDKKLHISDVTTGYEILEIQLPGQAAKPTTQPASQSAPPQSSTAFSKPPMESAKSQVSSPAQPEEALETDSSADPARKSAAASSVLRVDSKRIDNLLNLVSETVINKATFNQIANVFTETMVEFHTLNTQLREGLKNFLEKIPEFFDQMQAGTHPKDLKKRMSDEIQPLMKLYDPVEARFKTAINSFKSSSQNLSRIIGELHEGVLRIRMVPISQIFNRFPRLVRDLCKSLNKKVSLTLEGEDTELDKSVIEDLLDPLIHIVRNAIDHGIEDPEYREKIGKDEDGTLVMSAHNEGNMIIIEVFDDGKGIDVETIKRKAVERGLIHPTKILSDVEAFNLIFEPGFSTAKTVTNISGRGVGLDVVRKQIEKLNGTVTIWSEKGRGTRFTIKLPLTLAIIQGLLVRVGKEVYVIPITSVIDSHRILPSDIKIIDNYEVFNVRKDVISLLRLSQLFGIKSEEGQYQFVVIVGSGDRKMGLIVDSLIGEEDVVIKPLKDSYTASPGIAGATILGDGHVSLIIDVSQLLDLGMRQERELREKREIRVR